VSSKVVKKTIVVTFRAPAGDPRAASEGVGLRLTDASSPVSMFPMRARADLPVFAAGPLRLSAG